MENQVLIKVPEAAKVANVSRVQAYRLAATLWDEAGIVIRTGPRSLRINRNGLLAWAGEKQATA